MPTKHHLLLLNTLVYRVEVGYLLSLDKLLNNKAANSKIITPLITGNNTYHHPNDLI